MYNEAQPEITYPPRIESRAQSRKRTLAFILSLLVPGAPACFGESAEAAETEIRMSYEQYTAEKAAIRAFEHTHKGELKKRRIEKLKQRLAKEENSK